MQSKLFMFFFFSKMILTWYISSDAEYRSFERAEVTYQSILQVLQAMKLTKQCTVEYKAPASPQSNGNHELTHWGYKAKAVFYKSKLFIIMQVFWELIFCMNRFLPCLSVRISHRRCEQRHTNLRNAGWFLGCVFCFHCLIIHIFFLKMSPPIYSMRKRIDLHLVYNV